MRIFRYLHSRGAKAAVALAAAIILAAPYGCSKESKEPAEKAAEQAMAPAAPQDEAKAHFESGVQFSLKNELDAAIREYEAALALQPNIPEAHNNLGFAYMDQGELEKAVEHQKKAIELKPDLANGYFGLAMAYEKMGKKEEAIANWKEFAKLAQPHSKWWMKAQERIQALSGKAPAAPAK